MLRKCKRQGQMCISIYDQRSIVAFLKLFDRMSRKQFLSATTIKDSDHKNKTRSTNMQHRQAQEQQATRVSLPANTVSGWRGGNVHIIWGSSQRQRGQASCWGIRSLMRKSQSEFASLPTSIKHCTGVNGEKGRGSPCEVPHDMKETSGLNF